MGDLRVCSSGSGGASTMLHGEGQLHTWVCTVCWWEISGYVIAMGIMCRYNIDMKDDWGWETFPIGGRSLDI